VAIEGGRVGGTLCHVGMRFVLKLSSGAGEDSIW
jgi:hypothetical protein